MDLHVYRYCQMAIGAFVGALVGYSVAMGDLLLAIIAITVGLSLDYVCRTRVTRILGDEMIIRISERASRRAIQVFLTIAAVAGAILSTLRGKEYIYFNYIGYTLAYSVCFVIVLYVLFFWYYHRMGIN